LYTPPDFFEPGERRGFPVMVPQQPPFDDHQIVESFPEFSIQLPPLGEGSFKIAYRGIWQDGPAVLKVIKEPLNFEDEEEPRVILPARLDREVQSMRHIRSPRVVPIVAGPQVREVNSSYHVWYLEPYFDGGTLRDRFTGPFEEKDARDLCLALLEGVDALWTQAGLVHRDIKPANIAFDKEGQPVLLDLGIAFHPNATPLTNAYGFSPRTDAYAAPEQFMVRRLAPIDFRTDLFLVGVVIFEVYTGVHPFHVFDEPERYLERLTTGELDENALTGRPNETALKNVLRRLLKPSPNQRYRTPAAAKRAIAGGDE
jgi:serine/threonine-protein kinase